jgi:pimeloyl-ACP methyl ester carboxylesterase
VAAIYRSTEGRALVETLYRQALQRWPVPYSHLSVPTCEGETSVIASGDPHSPPLVLMHGSGTNAASWMRDVAPLAQRFRVYAIDMIGETGLSAPSRPPLASDRYAAWLDDVWRELGIASAHVVGVSLGAWLGLDFAIRRAEKVTSLVLLSPSGIGRTHRLTMLRLGLLRMCGTRGLRRSFAIVAGREMPAALVGVMTTVFTHFRPRLERIPIRTDEELAALRMPVLAILGGRDALLRSSETRDRLARLVPGARVTYLEQEGHMLPPQTAAIADFLAANAAMPHP